MSEKLPNRVSSARPSSIGIIRRQEQIRQGDSPNLYLKGINTRLVPKQDFGDLTLYIPLFLLLVTVRASLASLILFK